MGQATYGDDDARDLVEDSLQMLAQPSAAYPGDDLAAISLLASLIDSAEQVLTQRVAAARAKGRLMTSAAATFAALTGRVTATCTAAASRTAR